MANPIEVNYQVGRQIYAFRSSLASLTAKYYNTVTEAYENYSSANWVNYAILIPEVSPGYYRVMPPTASLSVPATEIIYEIRDTLVGPQISDAPAIANGNSQGVSIASVPGNPPTSIGSNPQAAVDIINIALRRLGQRKIVTIDDDSENARVAKDFYSFSLEACLRDCSWAFAGIIDALVPLNNETVPGWGYVYQYPSSCVFVRRIYRDNPIRFDYPIFPSSPNFYIPNATPVSEQFRILYLPDTGERVIVTNIYPAYIEYTARITDPTVYDQMFVKALRFAALPI